MSKKSLDLAAFPFQWEAIVQFREILGEKTETANNEEQTKGHIKLIVDTDALIALVDPHIKITGVQRWFMMLSLQYKVTCIYLSRLYAKQ